MDAEKLNIRLNLLANIGMLLGIIFLAFEIQQNSELTRIEISQSRAADAMYAQELSFNSEYIPSIRLSILNGEELSPEDTLRYRDYFTAINRNQDNILFQYNSGMRQDYELGSIESFVRAFIASSEHSRASWEGSKLLYSEEYVEFVDSILMDIPSSN